MSNNSQKSSVVNYFERVDGEGYICQIEKNEEICGAKLGLKMFNLKRHIERHHPDIFKTVLEEDIQDSSTSKQQMLSQYIHSEKINLSMTKEKFKRHLIQLVVDNGVALTLFSSPAFVGLHGEMAEKLGVSLSIKDTKNQHSSDFIKKMVEDVLNDFDISKQQVLAIVTDNASNMTLAVKKLSEDCFVDENEDDVKVEGIPTLDEISTLAFANHSEFKNMSHMLCAAHTLQLAIRDGLKVRHVASLISKIRQVVIAARTPKIDAILKRKTNKGAINDQATR
ncbi:unnamed protein product [Clavelina lepadiformis]|uniref:Uncharacterized protein n=1 Tax=Clavelina lepadiformis TaxID=159417 RepID=A0ABP0GED2_CLALP